jgi:hypothetical protein
MTRRLAASFSGRSARLRSSLMAAAFVAGLTVAAPLSPAGAQGCTRLTPSGTNCNIGNLVNPPRPSPGGTTISSDAPPGPTYSWSDTGIACDASTATGWISAVSVTSYARELAELAGPAPAVPGTVWVGRLVDPVTGLTDSGYGSCVAVGEQAPPRPPEPPTAEEIWGAALTVVPEVSLDPVVRGLTGLENHMWYQGVTADSVVLSLDGFDVTADITAIEFQWDMDGPTRDQILVYSSPIPGSAEEPAASHTYALPGEYQILHQVIWTGTSLVTGPGLPAGGLVIDLGTAALATARDYTVIEVRTPLLTR